MAKELRHFALFLVGFLWERSGVKPGWLRTGALVGAMLLGAFLPQAQVAAPAVRWLVVTMLFLVFLGTRWSRGAMRRSHLILLGANVVLGFTAWGVGHLVGGPDVALAAFFAGITPTATAAPVIMSFLGGRVDYVVTAFVLSNLSISALLPLMLPWLLGRPTPGMFAEVLGSVSVVVFLPLALAAGLRVLHPAAAQWPRRLGGLSFGLWLLALALITANASHYLRVQQATLPHLTLTKIAGVTALVCALNFIVGRFIGGRAFGREASQALGQKNTTFTIYLAMTFATPLVALGPTCYVIWHNLWNSWQLHRHRTVDDPSPR